MARPYQKKRTKWADVVMAKYFPGWDTWTEQVALYDFRGWDLKTVRSVGPLTFTRLMPRADLIAIGPTELLIIEFDSQMTLTSVTRLGRYVEAIQNDYVRPEWRELRIIAVYVTPGYDARFEAECARHGYRYIVEPQP